MTFIVSLVALLIERFFDWSHLRHWTWYISYQRFILQRFYIKSPYLAVAVIVLPLVIVAGVIQFLLQDVLYGFISLWFQLVVLLYCLGPQNLWADAFGCLNAFAEEDEQSVKHKLKNSFGTPKKPHTTTSLHRHFLNTIFVEANRRVFAVLFWYVAFGALGAVLYRAVTRFSAEDAVETSPELRHAAHTIEEVLNWLPARVLTFIFALGGHFVQVLSLWQKKVLQGVQTNDLLLTECGVAALGLDDQGRIPRDGSVEKHAIALLDRSFVISLVVIAVIAIVF